MLRPGLKSGKVEGVDNDEEGCEAAEDHDEPPGQHPRFGVIPW